MKMKSCQQQKPKRLRRIIIQSNTNFHRLIALKWMQTKKISNFQSQNRVKIFNIHVALTIQSLRRKWREKKWKFSTLKSSHKSNCEAIEWFIIKLEFHIISHLSSSHFSVPPLSGVHWNLWIIFLFFTDLFPHSTSMNSHFASPGIQSSIFILTLNFFFSLVFSDLSFPVRPMHRSSEKSWAWCM